MPNKASKASGQAAGRRTAHSAASRNSSRPLQQPSSAPPAPLLSRLGTWLASLTGTGTGTGTGTSHPQAGTSAHSSSTPEVAQRPWRLAGPRNAARSTATPDDHVTDQRPHSTSSSGGSAAAPPDTETGLLHTHSSSHSRRHMASPAGGGRKAKKPGLSVTASTAAAGTQPRAAAMAAGSSNPFAGGARSSAAGGAGCSRFLPSRRTSKCLAAVLVVAVIAAAGIGVGITLSRRAGRGAEEELPPVDGFLVVRNMKLERDCQPFYSAGFNAFNLVELALVTSPRFLTVGARSGYDSIRRALARAGASGMTTMRTWAHTSNSQFPFQVAPGQYSEEALVALDQVLAAARRSGLRVILSLIDNWKYYNGVDQYVDWSPTVPNRTQPVPVEDAITGDPVPQSTNDPEVQKYEVRRHALFFTDPSCRAMYRAHVAALAGRRNSVTGQLYRDDPTIMAWDLINEPRCESWAVADCPQLLQAWLEDMAAYVKTQAPSQLVTVGSEGFFARGSRWEAANPANWAADMGQDFMANNAVAGIDFATLHVWPDNWNTTSQDFMRGWLRVHLEAAQQLRKPLLLEEFGRKLLPPVNAPGGPQPADSSWRAQALAGVRDPVYSSTYDEVELALGAGQPLLGSLFWQLHVPVFADQGAGPYGVQWDDSTMEQLVLPHAAAVQRLALQQASGKRCMRDCWLGYRQLINGTTYNTCTRAMAACELVSTFTGVQQLQQGAQAFSRTERDAATSVVAARLAAFDEMTAQQAEQAAPHRQQKQLLQAQAHHGAAQPDGMQPTAATLNTTATQLLALAMAGYNTSGPGGAKVVVDALQALSLLQQLQAKLLADPATSAAAAAPTGAAMANSTLAGNGTAAGVELVNSTLQQLVSASLQALDAGSRAMYLLLTGQPMTAAQLQAGVEQLAATTKAGSQALAAQLAKGSGAAGQAAPGSAVAKLVAVGSVLGLKQGAAGAVGGGGGSAVLDGDVMGALLQHMLLGRFSAYPTRSGCCMPGSGAFDQGCSAQLA